MRAVLLAACLLLTAVAVAEPAAAIECHNNQNSPHPYLTPAWDDTHDERQIVVDECNRVIDLIYG